MDLPSSVYDYNVINDPCFLTLKMNGYLIGFFLQISCAWKAKINQDKQPDRPSHMGWPAHTSRQWEESILF